MSEALVLNALHKVEDLAEKLGMAESVLESGYAEFAAALLDVQENQYWELTHDSWGRYLDFIVNKFNLGKAQLYHKVAVVRELKGTVEPKDLSDMGISKASVLADIHRLGNGLPPAAIETAKKTTVTVKDLKKVLQMATHAPEQEKGEWVDLEFAFYVTAEEKAELQEALNAAKHMDPVISTTLKDFQQRKEIALRWAREFLATYTPEPIEESPCEDDGLPPVFDEDPFVPGSEGDSL